MRSALPGSRSPFDAAGYVSFLRDSLSPAVDKREYLAVQPPAIPGHLLLYLHLTVISIILQGSRSPHHSTL